MNRSAMNGCKLFWLLFSFLFIFVLDIEVSLDELIDETSCTRNNSLTVNSTHSLITLKVDFSDSIVNTYCLVYIINKDFKQFWIYDATVEVNGNPYFSHDFAVDVFAGHPDHNKPLKTLSEVRRKWSGHLPSWDMYIRLTSFRVTEYYVKISIKECMENCYMMDTPSGIPTTIYELPNQCGVTGCIDNYAVSYHIRANFLNPDQCSVHFHVKNDPSVCITIKSKWDKIQDCRPITIRIDQDIYLTTDRTILKPWCLPWTLEGRQLNVSWGEQRVFKPTFCTITLFTNTSNQGETCTFTTTSVNSLNYDKTHDNTPLMVGVTVASLVILLLSAILILYFIISRGRRMQNTQIVANFHHHSSVQVVSPPPYSVAIQQSTQPHVDDSRCRQSDTNRLSSTTSNQSVGTFSTDCCVESPPPYSET